ncbi:nucleolar protein dao-5-like [Pollicipes pollicipes]|uniref:nucleolar protein dao-5-like n=1 Tax=Pollicipes pollicipes TaxID=41117 RepID=UPI0018853D59|nr:nucleolar protein dao-5-like [Pollicipes pollicipes]
MDEELLKEGSSSPESSVKSVEDLADELSGGDEDALRRLEDEFDETFRRLATRPIAKPTTAELTEKKKKQKKKPADEPTKVPASEPTKEPASEPTKEPTSERTDEATPEPTKAPTLKPMTEPESELTKEPKSELTKEPTSEPTEVPTAAVRRRHQDDTLGEAAASGEASRNSDGFSEVSATLRRLEDDLIEQLARMGDRDVCELSVREKRGLFEPSGAAAAARSVGPDEAVPADARAAAGRSEEGDTERPELRPLPDRSAPLSSPARYDVTTSGDERLTETDEPTEEDSSVRMRGPCAGQSEETEDEWTPLGEPELQGCSTFTPELPEVVFIDSDHCESLSSGGRLARLVRRFESGEEPVDTDEERRSPPVTRRRHSLAGDGLTTLADVDRTSARDGIAMEIEPGHVQGVKSTFLSSVKSSSVVTRTLASESNAIVPAAAPGDATEDTEQSGTLYMKVRATTPVLTLSSDALAQQPAPGAPLATSPICRVQVGGAASGEDSVTSSGSGQDSGGDVLRDIQKNLAEPAEAPELERPESVWDYTEDGGWRRGRWASTHSIRSQEPEDCVDTLRSEADTLRSETVTIWSEPATLKSETVTLRYWYL